MEFTGERFTPGTSGEIEHEHHHRYLFALQFCAGRDVLDVASGEGYGSALLATVARSVIGVELVPEIVEHARRAYARENLQYRVGSATKLPLDAASTDAVVSFETLEHFSEHDAFMAEVKRVLRPGGTLVMSSPVRGVYSPGNPNPYHVRELTRAELEDLVGRSFRHAVYLSQTPVLGSILVPDEPCPPAVVAGQLFRKRQDGAFEIVTASGSSPYIVVVASDAPLAHVRAGALQDRPFLERLVWLVQQATEEAGRLKAVERELSERVRASEGALERARRRRFLSRVGNFLRRVFAGRRPSRP